VAGVRTVDMFGFQTVSIRLVVGVSSPPHPGPLTNHSSGWYDVSRFIDMFSDQVWRRCHCRPTPLRRNDASAGARELGPIRR
jgi:hypothetical protein